MTQEQIQEMHKRFDDRFELERQGCSECSGDCLIDKSRIRYPEGTYHCEYGLENIKAFIESEIDRAFHEGVEASATVLKMALDSKFKTQINADKLK